MIGGKLRYYPTVTREEFKTPGRMTDLIASGKIFQDLGLPPLDPLQDRAMICGSAAMLKDCRTMLDERGFQLSRGMGQLGDYVIEHAFVDK